MDDSVIKVLRRNGSWSDAARELDNEKDSNLHLKKNNEDFSLDKNFGILAEEIKKRMKLRSKDKSNSSDNSSSIIKKPSEDPSIAIKKKLLPFLKNIETLTEQRDNYTRKIGVIDEELNIVKNEIIKIKESYQKNLEELQNNIDFFEVSISLIDRIKGEL